MNIQETGSKFIEGFVMGAAKGLLEGKSLKEAMDAGIRGGLQQSLSAVPGLNPLVQGLEKTLQDQMNPYACGAGGAGAAARGVVDKLQAALGDTANAKLGELLKGALGEKAGAMAMNAMRGDPMSMLYGSGSMRGPELELAGQEALKKLLGENSGGAAVTGGGTALGSDPAGAERVLKNNYDKLKNKDGLIPLQTISEIATGGKCPDGSTPSAELKAACKQLHDNPGKFKALETTAQNDAGKADMLIGMNDLDASIKKQSPQQQLLDNFDKLKTKGGLITLQTLSEIANGGNCPDGSKPSPELKAACQKMHDNPAMFKATETARQGDLGKADMLMSKRDLQTALDRGIALDAGPAKPASASATGGTGGTGGTGAASLPRGAELDRMGQDQLMKLLADLLGLSASSGAGKPAGTAAAGGDPAAAEKTLKDNFSHLKNKNGLIPMQTISEIATGGKCPDGSTPSAELKAACKQLHDNPAKFKALETTAQNDAGKADMLIGMNDLDRSIKKHSPQQQLLDNFDKLKTKDGLVTLQTISEIATGGNCPDGSKPSAELKAACKQMHDNPAMFKATETARQGDLGKADMLMSKRDLQTTLK